MKSDPAMPSDSAWRDCTPGELVQLGAEQHRRAGRRAILRGLGMAAAGCAAVGAVGLVWYRQHGPGLHQPQPRFAPGGLACDEVTPLLPAYVAQKLDSQQTAKVKEHLAGCSHCRQRLEQLQQATSDSHPIRNRHYA